MRVSRIYLHRCFNFTWKWRMISVTDFNSGLSLSDSFTESGERQSEPRVCAGDDDERWRSHETTARNGCYGGRSWTGSRLILCRLRALESRIHLEGFGESQLLGTGSSCFGCDSNSWRNNDACGRYPSRFTPSACMLPRQITNFRRPPPYSWKRNKRNHGIWLIIKLVYFHSRRVLQWWSSGCRCTTAPSGLWQNVP